MRRRRKMEEEGIALMGRLYREQVEVAERKVVEENMGKEEAVRRPAKIQDRTGSSERLTVSLLLLFIPVFLNL